ncbi:MAG: hypothetical protein HXY30_09225 [Pseudorhodoplanes sp.]|nr:hypothetical protein [Pseudorhodoplanes sp.]
MTVPEGDEPNLVAHLLDSDVLAGEGLAEIDLPAIDADAPSVTVQLCSV